MCQLCGCDQYIKQGKQAVLNRATEIVKELGLTTANVDDYEDTERIGRFIAPFGAADDEVYKTAVWTSKLHMGMGRLNQSERYQAHVRALRDIYSRLPAKGEPKHVVTIYHQLEQLCRELENDELVSLAPEIREAVLAVKRVHDNPEAKEKALKQRYNL